MTFWQVSGITRSPLLGAQRPSAVLGTDSKHKLLPAWLSQHLLTSKNTVNDSDCKRRTRVGIVNATRVPKIWVVQCAAHKAGRNVPEIHL